MQNLEHDLECKIHRFEDKLLRSKCLGDQMKLQSILMNLRKELQNLKWENSKRERESYIGSFLFFILT